MVQVWAVPQRYPRSSKLLHKRTVKSLILDGGRVTSRFDIFLFFWVGSSFKDGKNKVHQETSRFLLITTA